MTDSQITEIFAGAGDFIRRELRCGTFVIYAYAIDGLVASADAAENIFRPISLNVKGETMQQLHEYGQLKAMQEQGWSREEFIRQFGKSFTDKLPEVSGSGYFSIDESEEYI